MVEPRRGRPLRRPRSSEVGVAEVGQSALARRDGVGCRQTSIFSAHPRLRYAAVRALTSGRATPVPAGLGDRPAVTETSSPASPFPDGRSARGHRAVWVLFDSMGPAQERGRFALRIEDTDRAGWWRVSEQQIYDSLHWLGRADEGPDVGRAGYALPAVRAVGYLSPYVDQLDRGRHAHCCSSRNGWRRCGRSSRRPSRQIRGTTDSAYGMTCEERAALPGFTETPVVRMLIP